MNKHVSTIIIFVLTFVTLGCAGKQNLVALLPNPDGSVGKVIVSNSKGTTTLDQAGDASSLKNAQAAPSAPFKMDKKELSRIFGPALNAQPQPPVHFILYFKSNSAELSDKSMLLLDKIIETIRERHSVDTSIVGHTDTAGDKGHNYQLSKRRAILVSELLVSRGVDPEILDITSHGEKNLLVKTGDHISEPKNRRVEVAVR